MRAARATLFSAVACLWLGCPAPTPVVDAGEPPPAGPETCDLARYVHQPDGVLDTQTGAVWFRWSEPERYTVDEGAAQCALQGGRLPTRAELEALLGGATGDGLCTLDPCAFDGVRCERFLTGTQNRAAEVAWAVDTISGTSVAGELGPYAVRCVR